MVDFTLDEDLELLRQTARDYATDVLAPKAAHADANGEFPLEQFRGLAGLGFAGMSVPEEFGGAGLGSLALALVLEEVNAACASTGVTLSVHCSLVCGPIAKHGTDEQKQTWLPRLASGEIIGAYALTEPDAGSDAANQKTTAVRDGDEWVLNGTKIFVTSGSHAGLVIVYARTGEHRTRGISAFLVDPKAPGFEIGTIEKKMGIRASSTAEIVLSDCRIPSGALLGEEGMGFHLALETLDSGRIGIASQALGIARASLEASIKYAGEREQFGRPIGDFQAIQWKLADMATEIDAARFLVWRAATLRDAGEPHGQAASMAKLKASRVANDAAQEAVQIHGGAGYTTEFPVERYMRDARITEIYEGATDIQRLVIARGLLAANE